MGPSENTQLHLQIQQIPWIHSPVRTVLALWQQLTKTEVSEPFIAEQTKSGLESVMFGVSIVVKLTQELARDFGSQPLKSIQLRFCCVPFWEEKELIKTVKFFCAQIPELTKSSVLMRERSRVEETIQAMQHAGADSLQVRSQTMSFYHLWIQWL